MKRTFILQRTSLAYLDVPDSAWEDVRAYDRFDRAYAALTRLSKRAQSTNSGWSFNTRLLDSRTMREVETVEVWDFECAKLDGVPGTAISASYEMGGGSGSTACLVLVDKLNPSHRKD